MDPSHYPGLSDDMQFRRHPDFYSAGGVADKMASSVAPHSHSGDAIHGHPSPLRHGTVQGSTSPLAGHPQANYGVSRQHNLYPAPPETHPRYRQSELHHAPQSWPPYEHGLAMDTASGMPSSYDYFPTASPYPPPRLSPPPTSLSLGGFGTASRHGPLAGSLDPTTGIFYRTPDHPRLRTAQACEKCRTRKAKCSGEHPACKRCVSRSLTCEYAKEGRVRGPNKPKIKPPGTSPEDQVPATSARNRSSSANTSSSAGSSEYYDVERMLTSLQDPHPTEPLSPTAGLAHARRSSLSLNDHRPNRPRPPNLQLDSTSNHYQQNAYFPSSTGSGSQPHRVPPFHLTPEEALQAASTPSSLPQAYNLSEPVEFSQYQSVYSNLNPSVFIRDPVQSTPNFVLAHTQSPSLHHPHRLRPQHDGPGSPSSIAPQRYHHRYQVSVEDPNLMPHHPDYSPQDTSPNFEGLHPHSTASRFNPQSGYIATFEGIQHTHETSLSGATGSSSSLTALAPAWGALEGGVSGVSSSVSESFSGTTSSGSSSIAAASPFSSASHPFEFAVSEQQNIASSPGGVMTNPRLTDAMRRRSASSFGEGDYSREASFHLETLGYP